MKKLLVLSLIILGACAPKHSGPVYLDVNVPLEDRVEDALSRMTLDEKIAAIMRSPHSPFRE